MYCDALITFAVTTVLFIFDPIKMKEVRTNVEYNPPKSDSRSKILYSTFSKLYKSSERKK